MHCEASGLAGTAPVGPSNSEAQATTPVLGVSATTLGFGSVAIDSRKVLTLTLTSTGTRPLYVKSVGVSGRGYSLLGATLPATLKPRQTLVLQVAFDPTIKGEEVGQVTILSNSVQGGLVSTALSGSGEDVAHSVELVWRAPATSSDPVAGYNVYRSLAGSSFQRLNETLLSQTTYVDSAVTDGATYVYEVKSVDKKAIEGVASNTTEVTVP